MGFIPNTATGGGSSTGVWSRINSYAPSAASSQSITLPDLNAEYEIYFNLTQNTTAGLLQMRVNADSGSNYKYSTINTDETQGVYSGVGDTAASWQLHGNSLAKINVSATITGRACVRTQQGNNHNANMFNLSSYCSDVLYNGADHNVGATTGGGEYAGAANVTAVSVITSAGTFTGTIELWEKLP